MKKSLFIQSDVLIPEHELEFSTSRSGGAGGQHVNKTDTRITVRWNVHASSALTTEQKEQLIKKLESQLTNEGDLIIHNSASRSQQQNRKNALSILAQTIRDALYIPKKRIPTTVPKALKQARLQKKRQRSTVKKLRSKKIELD